MIKKGCMRKPVIKILLFSLIFLAAAAAFAVHGAVVMGDNRKINADRGYMDQIKTSST